MSGDVDQTFPSAQRFHHGRDYGRVLRRRQRGHGRWLAVVVAPRAKRGPRRARLGILVSTKVHKHAVRRHQLKRWVREWFRTEAKDLLHGWDCVVQFRKNPPEQGHAEVCAELRRVVQRAMQASPAPRRPPA